ncbi:MAG: hypothetical protein AMJ55_13320 [Gammaproteobacteria bacterium SG8_15]|nr:MAG: hypothetical protein AMJ55_13320 [Gammaproteobacteria bacterium SG8_15]
MKIKIFGLHILSATMDINLNGPASLHSKTNPLVLAASSPAYLIDQYIITDSAVISKLAA